MHEIQIYQQSTCHILEIFLQKENIVKIFGKSGGNALLPVSNGRDQEQVIARKNESIGKVIFNGRYIKAANTVTGQHVIISKEFGSIWPFGATNQVGTSGRSKGQTFCRVVNDHIKSFLMQVSFFISLNICYSHICICICFCFVYLHLLTGPIK